MTNNYAIEIQDTPEGKVKITMADWGSRIIGINPEGLPIPATAFECEDFDAVIEQMIFSLRKREKLNRGIHA